MINQGFAYNAPKDSSTMRIVAITSVDPAARKATGMTRERSLLDIDCSFPVGGIIVTPAVGEQWYVEKIGLKYTLSTRLPANSAELLVEAQEGQVQVGSSGPLTLHGSEVQVGSKLKLGDTLYRDTDGVLETSTDGGITWSTALGFGSVGVGDINGLRDSLLNKADLVDNKIPDNQINHRVFQYANRDSFPETGQANTLYLDTAKKEVYSWINGAYALISSAAGAAGAILGSNATAADLAHFFSGFSGSGTLLDQVIQAITTLAGGSLEGLSGVLAGLGDLSDQIVTAITGWSGGTIEALRRFFEGFAGFNPNLNINNLAQQLGQNITGAPVMIPGVKTFFDNVRGFFGNIDFLPNGNFSIFNASQTFIESVLHPVGFFAKLGELRQNITGKVMGNIQDFFTNVRGFFGNIDFTPSNGPFSIFNGAQTFIESVLHPTGFFAKLGDLRQNITGKVVGNIQDFFTNVRGFFGNIDFTPNDGPFSIFNGAQTFIESVLHPTGFFAKLADMRQNITGNITGNIQTFFTNVRSFFGNHDFLGSGFSPGAAADTFIGSILNPRGIFANNSSLQTWTTGTVGGNIQTFFSNIRSFFGNHDFLGSGFTPGAAAQTFLNSILAPANDSARRFASLVNGTVPDGSIPTLLPGKIQDLVVGLTGNVAGNIRTFFDNVRSFFGNHDFLSGTFTAGGAAQTFLNSILAPANATSKRFAPLVNDQIPDGSIPTLLPGKIQDLVVGLTGNVAGNIRTFFDNVRSFFGNHDFLSNSFTPGGAAQTFLNSILAPANDSSRKFATLVNNQIPDGSIPTLLPGKIQDLVLGLTGNVTGNIRTFFDNVRSFFGNHDFLSSNFTAGGAASTFLNSILAPANDTSRRFAPLVNNQILDSSIPTLLPGKIQDLVVGLTGNVTGNIKTFFDNVRSFFGNHDFLSGSFTAGGAAQTFLNSVLAPANDTSRKFAGLVNNLIPDTLIPTLQVGKIQDLVGNITGNVTGNIQNFFTNVRSFFGNHDFLSGTFTPGAAATTFINSVLGPANDSTRRFATLVNNLIPDAQIPSLNIGKVNNLQTTLDGRVVIDDLVTRVTGASSGGMPILQNFFSGFSPFNGSNHLVNQFTDSLMGSADTLPRLKTFFSGFNPFDGTNTVVRQFGDAVSGSGIAAATLSNVKDFFTNVRSFLGNVNFLTTPTNFSTSLGSNVDNFVNSVLRPRGIFTANSDLAGHLGGTGAGDISNYFRNLSSMFAPLNLRTTSPSNFSSLGAGSQFIDNVLAQPASTVNALIPNLTHTKIFGLPGELGLRSKTEDLVRSISGISSGGTLDHLSTFFGGLPDAFSPTNSATTLVQQFVKNITGTAGVMGNIQNFFTNVKSFLGNPDFLTPSGNFSTSNAAGGFLSSILGPVNASRKVFAPLSGGNLDLNYVQGLTTGKITDINDWTQTNFSRPIISALTGSANDVGSLNTWARERLSRYEPAQSSNLVGNIASNLLGVIPVSHVAQTTPDLMINAYDAGVVNNTGSGWSWDSTLQAPSGKVGGVKMVISGAATRQLNTTQRIPVVTGDKLDVATWIKTSGFVGTSTHTVNLGGATGGSFRLTYDGVTSPAIAYNATASTVQTTLAAMTSIGNNVTVTGNAAGPYTINITGTANKLTGSSSLTGGSGLSIVSNCPIVLAIIPYVGSNPVGTITLGTTGAPPAGTTWAQLMGPTYTVPATVTSVAVQVGITSAATAGTIWWDTTAIKSGLLRQSLVDRLTDAWSNLWTGIFGSGGANRGVDDLLVAASAISSASGTADANGKTALVRISDMISGLWNAPANFINNIGTLMVDGVKTMSGFLSGLWESLTGLVSGGNRTATEVTEKMSALRTTSGTAADNADTAQKKALAAQNTADDATKLGVQNSADIEKIKATALPGTSNKSDYDNFDYTSPNLDLAKWSISSAVANAGYYRTDGAKAYWVPQGGVANTWVARFTKMSTKSAFQRVVGVLDTPLTDAPYLGSPESYIYLIGRTDVNFTNYVYARIGYNSITIWKKVNTARAQIGSPAPYTPKVGDTVEFLCGTSGGGILQFQVKVNGVPILTQADSTVYGGFLSVYDDPTPISDKDPNPRVAPVNNFGGFGGYAADRFGVQATLGGLSIWSIADNYPSLTFGSGCRVFRSDPGTVLASVAAGNNLFPQGWFTQVDSLTFDMAYDITNNRITAGIEGWYQVTINALGAGNITGSGGGTIRAALYKGGPGLTEAPVQYGPIVPANAYTNFPGVHGTFLVYLKAGEYVKPGYNSSWATGGAISGTQNAKWSSDSGGTSTWISMALQNRSYN